MELQVLCILWMLSSPKKVGSHRSTAILVGIDGTELLGWTRDEPRLLFSKDYGSIQEAAQRVLRATPGGNASLFISPEVANLAFVRPIYESAAHLEVQVIFSADEMVPISEDNISPMVSHINVSVIGFPPFVNYRDDGTLSGTDINVLDSIAKELGFTYDLVQEDSWLTENDDGSPKSGTIYSVMKGHSTLGIGDIVVTHMRYQLIDSSTYVYQLPFFLVGPKAKPYKPYLNMTKPYSVLSWIIFLACFVLYALTTALVWKYTLHKEDREHDLVEWLLAYIGILSSQPAPDPIQTPKSWGLSILFKVWLIGGFLFMAGYECNLRANIIVTDYEAPMETDADILDRGVQLHVSKGSIFAPLFRNSPSEIRREIGRQMDKNDNYYPYIGGMIPEDYEARIYAQGDAFLANDMMTRAMFPTFEERHNGIQPYRIGFQNFYPDTFSSFIITKGERRLRAKMDQVIQSLNEGGIVEHHIQSYIKPEHMIRNDVEDVELKPFILEQVFGAFAILVGGIFFSFGAFLMESFWHQRTISVVESKIGTKIVFIRTLA